MWNRHHLPIAQMWGGWGREEPEMVLIFLIWGGKGQGVHWLRFGLQDGEEDGVGVHWKRAVLNGHWDMLTWRSGERG